MESKRVVALFISAMVVSAVIIGVAVTQLMKARGGGNTTSAISVEIRDFRFSPENITVPVGSSVTWWNNDSVPHTVTSLAGAAASFDSGTRNPGSTFTFNFTVEGVYPYYCMIHPFMRGNVTVVSTNNTVSVEIRNFSFLPSELTVRSGTTVTWTNNDTMAHTVTTLNGSAQSFDSGIVNPGGTFTHTFTQQGVYHYYCMIHPFMLGNVTVTA